MKNEKLKVVRGSVRYLILKLFIFNLKNPPRYRKVFIGGLVFLFELYFGNCGFIFVNCDGHFYVVARLCKG